MPARIVSGESDMEILGGAIINLSDAVTCLKNFVKAKESMAILALESNEEKERKEKKAKKTQKTVFDLKKSRLEDHGYVLKSKEVGKWIIFKRIMKKKKKGKKERKFLRKVGMLRTSGSLSYYKDGKFLKCKKTKKFLEIVGESE